MGPVWVFLAIYRGYISIYDCCHFAFQCVFCQRSGNLPSNIVFLHPSCHKTPAVPRSNLEQTRRDHRQKMMSHTDCWWKESCTRWEDLIGSDLYHYLQGLWWCRTSSINTISMERKLHPCEILLDPGWWMAGIGQIHYDRTKNLSIVPLSL